MIVLGRTYRDIITGFEGVCVGKCEYISGCNQALLQPRGEKRDVRPSAEWFDVQRVKVVGTSIILFDNGDTPGADKEAPKR